MSRSWSGVSCDSQCSQNGKIQLDPKDNPFCACDYTQGEIALSLSISNESSGFWGPLCDVPGCPGNGPCIEGTADGICGLSDYDRMQTGVSCSGHGECNAATATCECEPGWQGPGTVFLNS